VRRLFFVIATLLVACGAVVIPGPPECEEPRDLRPCPDGGLRDAPSDVLKYVDAPIITVAPTAH